MSDRRPVKRFMLALAVLGSSGCANLSSRHPVTPYGAARVEDVDTAELGRSLALQVKADGISNAVLNLFPDRLPAGARQGETIKSKDGYLVVGLLGGTEGSDFMKNSVIPTTRSWIITNLCRCASTGGEFAATFKYQRIFVGLHEPSHLEALAQGENPGIDCIDIDAHSIPRRAGIKCNRAERIADASASLYMMSNFHESGKYPEIIEQYRSLTMEPTHYTVSSIAAAVKAYRKEPRPGLSIRQTEQWAVQIVNSQPNLDREYDLASQVYRDINEQTLVTLPRAIQNGLRKVAESRAALFGPIP